jgi:Uncharacterized protein conserved in bacteria
MDKALINANLKTFLSDNKLKSYPAKHKMKVLALMFLADKFDVTRVYTQTEVNDVLIEICCFPDYATVRRELCDFGFLLRDAYGKEYRVAESEPTFPDLFPDFYH